ncbi:hypothetical protein D3C78_1739450 [compost metagenome]
MAVVAAVVLAGDAVVPYRLFQIALVGVQVAAGTLRIGGIVDCRRQRMVVKGGLVRGIRTDRRGDADALGLC